MKPINKVRMTVTMTFEYDAPVSIEAYRTTDPVEMAKIDEQSRVLLLDFALPSTFKIVVKPKEGAK